MFLLLIVIINSKIKNFFIAINQKKRRIESEVTKTHFFKHSIFKVVQMISNMKARINRALLQGLSVNAFCAKMQATKGALRSLIFKMWFKLSKGFKHSNNALTFVVTGRNNRGQLTGDIETIKAAQKALLIPFNVFSLDSFTIAQFKAAGFTVIVEA
jgi:hypothetical protein